MSAETSGHTHEYLKDEPGEACVFCGAPRPATTLTEAMPRGLAAGAKAAREAIRWTPVPALFLSGRDPGDEDR